MADNPLEKFANMKPIVRMWWPIESEPVHLPKDHYEKVDIGIIEKYICWQETDKAFKERVQKTLKETK